MFGRFPEPSHMPCGECGASVARADTSGHVCERERWLDYQALVQSGGSEQLSQDMDAYFESAEGRFAVWYAERERRRREDQ